MEISNIWSMGEVRRTMFDYNEEVELSEFDKMLKMTKLREMMMTDEQRISPDTYGCDCMFLRYFVTPAMEEDFGIIAHHFLEHEAKNLVKYYDLQYVNDDPALSWPTKALQNIVLNMMMSAANTGNEFARVQFCYLHKTYYKKEYKQLKRFNKISAQEVSAIAVNKDGNVGPFDVARVLTMARLYGIEIQPNCNFLYIFMDEESKRYKDDDDTELYMFSEEVLQESIDQLQEWYEDEMEILDDYQKTERFLRKTLRYFGIGEDYIDLCNEECFGMEREYQKTIALYHSIYPQKKITKEELPVYVAIVQCIGAISGITMTMHEAMKAAIGDRDEFYEEDYPPLYHPEEVVVHESKREDKPSTEKIVVKEVVKESTYNEQALLDEIDRLRSKVHMQENENRDLRNQISEGKKTISEQDAIKKKYEEEHEELVALRNHVYNFTEYDQATTIEDIDMMKEAIAKHHITIIGGHDNWVRKLKSIFPDWTYISPGISSTVSEKLVMNSDKVYFFTDTISHGTYYKYIRVIRDQHIPFGYIHGVNIDGNVAQIYGEMEK